MLSKLREKLFPSAAEKLSALDRAEADRKDAQSKLVKALKVKGPADLLEGFMTGKLEE